MPNITRFSTGNEFVAVPDVLRERCGILDISFLYMQYRSLIELHGAQEAPLVEPTITLDGITVDLSAAFWEQEHDWIPAFRIAERGLEVRSRIFAPLAHRGFDWVLELTSTSEGPIEVEVGWKGLWRDTYHVVNLSKPMRGERFGAISKWEGGIPFVEFRGAAPLFAVAFCPSEPMNSSVSSDGQPGNVVNAIRQGEVVAREGENLRYNMTVPVRLAPGEKKSLALYVGLGLEEMSAVTSSVDLKRHGWETSLSDLAAWLERHRLAVGDAQIDRILNLNSLYNYFFSQAVTLDTEELVLVTARSSRYALNAAYRDRDAMRWSMPAVLQTDPAQARKMLEYALTKQLKNVGIHSRFIDGVVLEPGFQLDELCAPIHALNLYVQTTHDMSILFDRRVQSALNRIIQLLSSRRQPDVGLYDTMLLPSGDVSRYPYVTFDNVLVWRVLTDLAWMYELIHDMDRSDANGQSAAQVQRAIMDHCVVDGPFGPMFAWAVDLRGNWELHNDPPGSLQLLSWLEFCAPEMPVYRNTVRWIHSDENPASFHAAPFAAPGWGHDPHPSVISVAIDLLTGRKEQALGFLRRAEMDDGIACETVDENTGRVRTGGAFATCAGWLAFGLATAFGAGALRPELEPSERLYEPPPPEFRDSLESPRH